MIGKRIKQLRLQFNMTQKELADKLHVTPKTVSFYELEQRSPADDIKINLTKIFNVSMDYLMGLSDIRNPYTNTNEAEEEDFDPLTIDVDIAAHNEGEFTEAELKQLKELIKKYGK